MPTSANDRLPTDRLHNPLNVGDVVAIPAEVVSIEPYGDYCNLTVRTCHSMFPGEHKTIVVLNAKQVLLLKTKTRVKSRVDAPDVQHVLDAVETIKSDEDASGVHVL